MHVVRGRGDDFTNSGVDFTNTIVNNISHLISFRNINSLYLAIYSYAYIYIYTYELRGLYCVRLSVRAPRSGYGLYCAGAVLGEGRGALVQLTRAFCFEHIPN
jgi:hypothetical protein